MAQPAPSVTLADMLDARERRAERQRSMRVRHPQAALISFTLNIAGPVKLFELAEQAFWEGRQLIERQLARHRLTACDGEAVVLPTGCEALWAVEAAPLRLKALMCAIEDGGRLGRLFDIDVLTPEGEILSRTALEIPPRRCLLCERPAHECARSRAHSVELLWDATCRIIRAYFLEQRADAVAAMACKSLLYEVSTTPKPGLVDRANCGAHRDMDLFSFLDSSAALTPHFRQLFLMGALHAQDTPQRLFDCLRYPGMLAEEDMFAATGGVNTHKGLIFSLGLVCAALGYLFSNGLPEDTDALLALCGEMASPAVCKDLSGVTRETATTFGERLFVETGRAGIRDEAAAGFPSVRLFGLPA
ncbi:MAG: citrate lyase holo-[acyl-carrier protein] synthase, partial [Oscillospiraceae bacterium]